MQSKQIISEAAPTGSSVTAEQVASVVAQACPESAYRDKRILLIVPDGTRTAPIGLLFQSIHKQIGSLARSVDVLIALGTHQPMNDAAICQRLEITPQQRAERYRQVRFFNHQWDNPEALKNIGIISAEEISSLTNGLFAMDVPVEINRMLFDDDQVIIVGPV